LNTDCGAERGVEKKCREKTTTKHLSFQPRGKESFWAKKRKEKTALLELGRRKFGGERGGGLKQEIVNNGKFKPGQASL